MTHRHRHRRLRSLVLLLALAAQPARADDPVLAERLATFPKINAVRDVDWYAPVEVAQGCPGPALKEVADPDRFLDPGARRAAIDYARARGSAALLVWQGGRLLVADYGANFAPDGLTDTASMHKSVMALLYGAALRDGAIRSLDDSAATYLPEWAGDERRKITLRHLLTMASGLENPPTALKADNPAIQLLLASDIAAVALSRKAVAEPGVTFDYNGADSEILGVILERATGARYADYLSRVLLKPLGTGDARVWLDRDGGMAHTFCCLQMRAEDWLRVGVLIKSGGTLDGRAIIPETWIRQMTTPSATNPNYGLHVWLADPHAPARAYNAHSPFKIPAKEPFLARDMVFFDGWGAQRVYVSAARDLVIVRLGDVSLDWDDSFLPNLIASGLK